MVRLHHRIFNFLYGKTIIYSLAIDDSFRKLQSKMALSFFSPV